jgi:hypothetical protein
VAGSVVNDPVQAALDLDTVQEDATVTYRLVLPGTPPSKNEIGSWPPAWKASAKKRFMRQVAERAKAQGIPRDNREIGLAAHLVFPTASRRDPQNYAETLWNWVPDALQGCTAKCSSSCLVHCGVLVDDNEGRIQWPPNLGVTFGVDSRHAPAKVRKRTVITISVRKAVPRTEGGQE